MDLDDFLKLLIPKSKRKKLKKQLKRGSLIAVLIEVVRAFLGSDDDRRSRPQPEYMQKTAVPPPAPRFSLNSDDPMLQNMAQAKQYQANIEALVQSTEPESVKRVRMEQLSERVAMWVRTIGDIVQRTAVRRDDPLIAAELKRVPKAIVRLEKDLQTTTDPALRQKLEKTLNNRRRQLSQLEQANNNLRIAELKVENTLAQLGTIYSQLHSGQYLAERSSYERLAADISHEVDSLEDYLSSLAELQEENNRRSSY